jgi:hypothetical protein
MAATAMVDPDELESASLVRAEVDRLPKFDRLLLILYFPRLSVVSCRKSEQPLRDGLNSFGGDPRADNRTNLLDQ